MGSAISPFTSLIQLFTSARLERVVSQVSYAIITAIAAIPAPYPHDEHLLSILESLAKWGDRPSCLRVMAYGWCSAICKRYQSLEDGKKLLFLSLKIGFRGLNPPHHTIDGHLIHTKHHWHIADIVFNSRKNEAIADLLEAWVEPTATSHKLLDTWPKLLVRLRPANLTSQRLRRLAIYSLELIGPQVRDVGVEELIALLDRLSVGVADIALRKKWLWLLLYIVQSPEGRRSLSYPHWEFMVELADSVNWFQDASIDCDLEVMFSLEEEEEWDKLECWSGLVWSYRSPKIDTITEDLERATLSLLRQRPGALRKLQWRMWASHMEDPSEYLRCLRWICERGGLEVVSQEDPL